MNTALKKVWLATSVAFCASWLASIGAYGQAQQTPTTTDPAKKRAFLEMIEVTGLRTYARTMFDQAVDQAKAKAPNVPNSYWAEYRRSIREDDFIDVFFPVYEKFLTTEDLKATSAFYKTPAGQHYIKALPQLTSESMAAGQTWLKQSVDALVVDLRAKGYLPQPTR